MSDQGPSGIFATGPAEVWIDCDWADVAAISIEEHRDHDDVTPMRKLGEATRVTADPSTRPSRPL